MVWGASRAGASARGALWVARGIRGGGGSARGQPRMLSDGGDPGSRSGRETDGDTLRDDQRSLGGERGRSEAERKDTLRQRQRECQRVRGASTQAHAGDRDHAAACGGGA